jgi:tetratricopeptide (TPR) repeat protein
VLNSRIEEANRAETEGRWRDAIEAFTRLGESSGDSGFFVRAAMAAEEGGFNAEAESILRAAIARDPGCGDAFAQLAWLLHRDERLDEARSMIASALAIRETQPGLNLLGSIERQLGHHGAALAALRRSLELRPDDDEAHHMLGLALQKEDPLTAVAHFERAHELDPSLPHVLREWGRALWYAGRFEEAIVKVRAAISFDSSDAWAHCYLGHLLLETNQIVDAKSAFERAVALEPRHGFFWGNLARAHEELGELSAAERIYRKGLSVEFDGPYLYARYGIFLKRMGKLSRAKKYLRRAIDMNPNDRNAREALAELS